MTAFREASTVAGGGARLRGGRPLDRRGRALRRLDRAVALRARDAGDPGDGRRGQAPISAMRSAAARQAIVDKGCRRGAAIAQLGARLRRAWPAASSTRRRAELTDALDVRRVERGDRAHPAAPVGPGRGRAAGRRAGSGVDPLPGRLRPLGRGRGARAPDPVRRDRASGRRSRPAGLPRPRPGSTMCRHCSTRIPDVAGAALDHGAGPRGAGGGGDRGSPALALESAVDGWDRHGRAWEATWARLDLAHCLIRIEPVRRGRRRWPPQRARPRRRLELPVLADRADALLRMARGHASDDEPWRPLTSREFEVARLIGEGLTNAEIADSLGIAPKTASSHVEHILAKLGASRRTEIATWASHVRVAPGRRVRPGRVEHATRSSLRGQPDAERSHGLRYPDPAVLGPHDTVLVGEEDDRGLGAAPDFRSSWDQ